MERLSQAALLQLPALTRQPAYDRSRLDIGMAHLGVGAFHRCHQAEFTDDMLERRFGPWGVVGINLRPPRLSESLAPQDGLYTRTLRQGDEAELRVIGCIKRVIDAEADTEAAIAALADPGISVVTLTITEKGYCHIPSTGELDRSHPDIVADLKGGAPLRSAPGLIAAALARRATPVTLISCDNIPGNGRILETVVRAFAPHLGDWIDANVRFPSTMVDRIVPATMPQDLDFAGSTIGYSDGAAVVGEPFRQWVIEDNFAGPRPPWDLAGAQFVPDVHGHELIKMRLLNAAQSAFAYFGALCGLEYTWQSARDPVLAGLVRRMLVDESASTVPDVAGMEAGGYIEQVFERVANPAIRHTNHQVATDGSQKIVQRLLNPIRDRIRAGQSFDGLALAVAAWLAYLLAASPAFGARWKASDPWAARIAEVGEASPHDLEAIVAEVVGLSPIFGNDLNAPLFRAAIHRLLAGFHVRDPRDFLASLA